MVSSSTVSRSRKPKYWLCHDDGTAQLDFCGQGMSCELLQTPKTWSTLTGWPSMSPAQDDLAPKAKDMTPAQCSIYPQIEPWQTSGFSNLASSLQLRQTQNLPDRLVALQNQAPGSWHPLAVVLSKSLSRAEWSFGVEPATDTTSRTSPKPVPEDLSVW